MFDLQRPKPPGSILLHLVPIALLASAVAAIYFLSPHPANPRQAGAIALIQLLRHLDAEGLQVADSEISVGKSIDLTTVSVTATGETRHTKDGMPVLSHSRVRYWVRVRSHCPEFYQSCVNIEKTKVSKSVTIGHPL